jgi:hypothetical protein
MVRESDRVRKSLKFKYKVCETHQTVCHEICDMLHTSFVNVIMKLCIIQEILEGLA